MALLCFSADIYSQKMTQINEPVIPFGIADTAHYRHISYVEIVATPYLTCRDTSCTIVSYYVSILGRCRDYQGPYLVFGSKLQGRAWEIINSSQGRGEGDKIFIGDILVKYHDKIMSSTASIMLECDHR